MTTKILKHTRRAGDELQDTLGLCAQKLHDLSSRVLTPGTVAEMAALTATMIGVLTALTPLIATVDRSHSWNDYEV